MGSVMVPNGGIQVFALRPGRKIPAEMTGGHAGTLGSLTDEAQKKAANRAVDDLDLGELATDLDSETWRGALLDGALCKGRSRGGAAFRCSRARSCCSFINRSNTVPSPSGANS